ncbi:hypothetical protein [Bacillus cereus]|uniref:hypothetical protein n=1 Tax=Bacillus cereus TaxID=1396 RepID=UPI003879E1D9
MSVLSRYLWAVRPPPQNLAKAKKLGEGSTARKSPIGSNNNHYSCIMSVLSRYLWAVRPPPQNLAKAKKLGEGSTARKSPIGSTNNQWGINKTPTD